MSLSAALPVTWSPILIYFGITIILGLLDWTGLARAVRSKLLALREEDSCTAAQLMGARPGRIIRRHLLPSFMSHLIASATLSIPSMILGETALSFLGLGLRPPITSWGVLLSEAQNINVVALYPWLMLPVVPVIIVVLAFNFSAMACATLPTRTNSGTDHERPFETSLPMQDRAHWASTTRSTGSSTPITARRSRVPGATGCS